MTCPLVFVAALVFFSPLRRAYAGACCGGAIAAPGLILDDSKHLLQSQSSYLRYKENGSTLLQSLSVASRLTPNLQISLSVPWLEQMAPQGQPGPTRAGGLGDVQASLTYQVLRGWHASEFGPNLYVFAGRQFETGFSKIESTFGGWDRRGLGLAGNLLGLAIQGDLKDFFYFLILDQRFLEPKRIQSEIFNASLDPSHAGQVLLSVGYRFSFDQFISLQFQRFETEASRLSGSFSTTLPKETQQSFSVFAGQRLTDKLLLSLGVSQFSNSNISAGRDSYGVTALFQYLIPEE